MYLFTSSCTEEAPHRLFHCQLKEPCADHMQTLHHFNFKTPFFSFGTQPLIRPTSCSLLNIKNLLCSTQGKACYPRHPAFQSLHPPQAMAIIKLGGSAGEHAFPPMQNLRTISLSLSISPWIV